MSNALPACACYSPEKYAEANTTCPLSSLRHWPALWSLHAIKTDAGVAVFRTNLLQLWRLSHRQLLPFVGNTWRHEGCYAYRWQLSLKYNLPPGQTTLALPLPCQQWQWFCSWDEWPCSCVWKWRGCSWGQWAYCQPCSYSPRMNHTAPAHAASDHAGTWSSLSCPQRTHGCSIIPRWLVHPEGDWCGRSWQWCVHWFHEI